MAVVEQAADMQGGGAIHAKFEAAMKEKDDEIKKLREELQKVKAEQAEHATAIEGAATKEEVNKLQTDVKDVKQTTYATVETVGKVDGSKLKCAL